MTTNKVVRLMCYLQNHEETWVEGFEAKDWGDFVIIAIDTDEYNDETLNSLSALFSAHYKEGTKQAILIPSSMDISFYGVEVAQEIETNANTISK